MSTKANLAMNLTLLFILFVSSFNDYLVSSFTSSSVPASQRIEWRKRTDVDGELNSSPTIWLHKCRTMETLVEMSKDELGTNGELIRRCHGQALVSKCEGACISNLRPSIQTPTGLLKECNCCRETSMHSKRIVLDNCFDLDDNALEDEKMIITVNEPRNCACFKCANRK
ncbi:hypothetical protein DERF_006871 [Dermatophagoides farinae]|uniref:Partner of bursicon n=1 Tax=Dermatophagoides farinae TaxID=6954 RepID=A0A922HY70_DERFA|nr:partner of bursicon-like isoform X2 [Dermatophagoides farinae]KAH9516109.1 hypothetical protein DERF_006871 [Dermatophagoides farinae]